MICLQVQASIQEKETYRKELTLAKEKVDTDDDESEDTDDVGDDVVDGVGNGIGDGVGDTCKGKVGADRFEDENTDYDGDIGE